MLLLEAFIYGNIEQQFATACQVQPTRIHLYNVIVPQLYIYSLMACCDFLIFITMIVFIGSFFCAIGLSSLNQ